MNLFALSDPHLSFSNPDKKMDKFGEVWMDHPRKIKQNWEKLVGPHDVVVIPGDISWARELPQAMADMHWLHSLSGTKILLKGNHDFWWPSAAKLRASLPSSIHAICHDHLEIGNFVFFGSRLWETEEYSCNSIIDWDPKKGKLPKILAPEDQKGREKKYSRELVRLQLSIDSLPKTGDKIPIGICHYPPLGPDLEPSRASILYRSTGTQHVIFGHLHSVRENSKIFGKKEGMEFHLTSCDYIHFTPKWICGDS